MGEGALLHTLGIVQATLPSRLLASAITLRCKRTKALRVRPLLGGVTALSAFCPAACLGSNKLRDGLRCSPSLRQ